MTEKEQPVRWEDSHLNCFLFALEIDLLMSISLPEMPRNILLNPLHLFKTYPVLGVSHLILCCMWLLSSCVLFDSLTLVLALSRWIIYSLTNQYTFSSPVLSFALIVLAGSSLSVLLLLPRHPRPQMSIHMKIIGSISLTIDDKGYYRYLGSGTQFWGDPSTWRCGICGHHSMAQTW